MKSQAEQTGMESSLAVAFLALILGMCPVAVAGEVSLKMIEAAWQARKSRITSGEISWVSSCTVVRGPHAAPFGERRTDAFTTRQPKVNRYKGKRSFIFDREKFRLVIDEPGFFESLGRYDKASRIAVFDGATSATLTHVEVPDAVPYQGTISSDSAALSQLLSDLWMKPIVQHLFFQTDPAAMLAPYQLSEQPAVFGDSRCVVLNASRPELGGRRIRHISLWLLPDKGFSVCRRMEELEGRLVSQLDVWYELCNSEFMPSRWKWVDYTLSGTFDGEREANVVSMKINERVPEGAFKLAFPVGTVVFESGPVEGTDRRVVQYIVQRDGSRRMLSNADHSDLLAMVQEAQSGWPGGSSRAWIALMALVIPCVVLILCVMIRRWRKPL